MRWAAKTPAARPTNNCRGDGTIRGVRALALTWYSSAIRRPIVPLFFFDLRTNSRHVVDHDGIDLLDVETARTYARGVARDLMFRSEPSKRHWLMVVRDQSDNELFEVPFIAVDESLKLHSAETRTLLVHMCEKRRA